MAQAARILFSLPPLLIGVEVEVAVPASPVLAVPVAWVAAVPAARKTV
jgi:hypothetical protein